MTSTASEYAVSESAHSSSLEWRKSSDSNSDNYNRITMVATFGGPIRIPPLFYHRPNFFVAYQWARNGSASTGTGVMPTTAERNGVLTDGNGQPFTIYNPAAATPFPGPIPVSPQAQALLALYPLPNITVSTAYIYEESLLSDTHKDALQSRLDKSLGHRDSLYGGFSFETIRANSQSLFGFVDTSDTLGMSTNINWQHRFERQLFATVGYQFSRLRTELVPQFAYANNISGNAENCRERSRPKRVATSVAHVLQWDRRTDGWKQ